MDGAPRLHAGGKSAFSDAELLSRLIGDAYDAAIDPDLWTSVLEKICTFVPGSMANIFSQDAVNKSANAMSAGASIQERYAAINPLSPTVVFLPVGEAYSLADVISHAEMRKTRLYREWMEPQGNVDLIGYSLERSATGGAFHVVVRHDSDGLIDDEARRRVQLVGPHLRRAVLARPSLDTRVGPRVTDWSPKSPGSVFRYRASQ